MGRLPHLIKDNKTLSYPRRFLFFDTETLPKYLDKDMQEHILRLGVACYYQEQKQRKQPRYNWFNFTTPERFWEFLFSKTAPKETLYVIAHNLPYDFRVVKGFEYLKHAGWLLKNLIIDNSVSIWCFRKDKKSIVFLDSMNWFNMSLHSLGECVNLPKLAMPKYEALDAHWLTYCYRDVEIIVKAFQAWLKFLKENNLGSFGKTLASQCLNAYRHRFMLAPIWVHPFEKVTKLERESYHGGRCECFFLGTLKDKNLYHLDVNSMYPYVMSANQYPHQYDFYTEKGTLFALDHYLKDHCVVAEVKLKTLEPVFPFIKDGRLCFPIGTFKTVLTTRELQYARKHDYIKDVYRLSAYHKADLFSKYIDFFYKKRQEYKKQGNTTFDYLCKLMLNSLYGKFGQKNEVFEKVDYNPELEDDMFKVHHIDTGSFVTYRIVNGVVEEAVGEVEGYNSFCAIASHISADARMLLWGFISQADPVNVFYCDTDSLFVNHSGYVQLKKYLSNTGLGKLKLVETAKYLQIRGLKDYTFGHKNKLKGIKIDAEKLKDGRYLQWHFEGLRGALRKGRINKMVLVHQVKEIKGTYTKGRVLQSGYVKPFKIA